MNDQTSADGSADEDYHHAVLRAGVIELPDDGEFEPAHNRLPDLPAGRFEDSDAPGVPR